MSSKKSQDGDHEFDLSIVWSWYGQRQVMEVHWNRLRALDDRIARAVELVLVDDGHPVPLEVPADILERFAHQVIRLDRDVPWNQMTARNIGCHHARGRVLLLLDPDMVPQSFGKFWYTTGDMEDRTVIRFCLRSPDGKVNTTSPNTWLVPKAVWDEVGGYNETYQGHKGWSDVELLQIYTSWPDIKLRQKQELLVDYLDPESGWEDARVEKAAGVDRDVAVNKGKHLRNHKEVYGRYQGNWARWWTEKKKNQKFLTTTYKILSKR